MAMFKIFCKLGDETFDVTVLETSTVSDLKKKIKEANEEDFKSVDARNILLARVYTENLNGVDDGFDFTNVINAVMKVNGRAQTVVMKVDELPDAPKGFFYKDVGGNVSAKVMNPSYEMVDYFLNRKSSKGTVDVVVILPTEKERESTPSPEISGLPEQIASPTDGVALQDPILLKREHLVLDIIKALDEDIVVRVSSPPASGKSALISLIINEFSQRKPGKRCITVNCYKFRNWMESELESRKSRNPYFERNAQDFVIEEISKKVPQLQIVTWKQVADNVSYLFLDDAQFLYNSAGRTLFDEILKSSEDRSMHVGVFTSFYAESVEFSSPVWLKKFGYTSLRLTIEETNDLMEKLLQRPSYEDHAIWFRPIFKILQNEADGHVGLLRIWSQHMLNYYRDLKITPMFAEALRYYYGELPKAPISIRIFGHPSRTINDDERQLLRNVLLGKRQLVPEPPTATTTQDADPTAVAARSLMRQVVLTDENGYLQFATPLHKRYFSRLAFPSRLSSLPSKVNKVDEWLLLVLQTFEPESINNPESFNAKNFSKEGPMQHAFWRGALSCLPPSDFLFSEISKRFIEPEPDLEISGELDFWINGIRKWAIELLVCGSKKSEHLKRMKRVYADLEPSECRVVDFRPMTMESRGEHDEAYVAVYVDESYKGADVVFHDKYAHVDFTGLAPTDEVCNISDWTFGKYQWKKQRTN